MATENRSWSVPSALAAGSWQHVAFTLSGANCGNESAEHLLHNREWQLNPFLAGGPDRLAVAGANQQSRWHKLVRRAWLSGDKQHEHAGGLALCQRVLSAHLPVKRLEKHRATKVGE